ncbi:MAG: TetR/AcrR family transcriptional regulator [Pseudomonadota bacterium]|nr:TetR/AcrR family transcriptional regulator [Pseudomonadota bacterium]
MKVSREQATENRGKILTAAAKLFRQHGFEGISVADLMKKAGLTHGGFYGHFSSKEELMAQACTQAFSETLKVWKAALAGNSPNAIGEFARTYLTVKHRDLPGSGCAASALAVDASRQGPLVREALTTGVREHLDIIAQMSAGKTAAARRDKAMTTYAALIGALVLSRAVDDEKLSEGFLRAVRESVSKPA